MVEPGVAGRQVIAYTIHMKRTNLVLDAHLLESAMRELGSKTYSDAVNLALKEVMRMRQIQALLPLFGQGLWQGDLSEMREDRSRRKTRRRSVGHQRAGR